MEIKSIGVLGAGTWGMALARLLANKNYDVTVWSALEGEIEEYSSTRKHPNLPGMTIPDSIVFTKDLESALSNKGLVLFAVPSVYIRETAKSVAPLLKEKKPIIVTVAKGIEKGTSLTMSQIIEDELGDGYKVAALSGPTHAEEVALDQPTTIVAACEDLEIAKIVQDTFMTDNLRVYTNKDINGVELCGAMKNVIALAVGISDGLGFGDNAKAALITRGMREIYKLGTAMGCDDMTFYGLAGIGDLIVTATSRHSRNNRCGQLIGQGYTPEAAVKEVGMVVEGLNALPSIMELASKFNIEVPVSSMLDNIVNKGIKPKDAAIALMQRERKGEFL